MCAKTMQEKTKTKTKKKWGGGEGRKKHSIQVLESFVLEDQVIGWFQTRLTKQNSVWAGLVQSW